MIKLKLTIDLYIPRSYFRTSDGTKFRPIAPGHTVCRYGNYTNIKYLINIKDNSDSWCSKKQNSKITTYRTGS
jgi:hypothetical protein